MILFQSNAFDCLIMLVLAFHHGSACGWQKRTRKWRSRQSSHTYQPKYDSFFFDTPGFDWMFSPNQSFWILIGIMSTNNSTKSRRQNPIRGISFWNDERKKPYSIRLHSESCGVRPLCSCASNFLFATTDLSISMPLKRHCWHDTISINDYYYEGNPFELNI